MWSFLPIARLAPRPVEPQLELAAESIAIKIRWFGLFAGAILANIATPIADALALNLILFLGLIFTIINTICFRLHRVFLRDDPIMISALEALFIGLLCWFETGVDSPFRFYYLLSLICCAIRYSPRITFVTCGLDCLSYGGLFLFTDQENRTLGPFLFTLVILIWSTWAAGAMARLFKQLSEQLRIEQTLLETRIAERSQQLEESQAQVLHQEKMAAFGLLAAGIAHEVGNPLTSISSIVQMLERRELDSYTHDKLQMVTGQLNRIQTILRELVTFSRPASVQNVPIRMTEVVEEALNIAKYYKGGKNREIVVVAAPELPLVRGIRDQLVQVVFNFVLNAIDATDKGGRIEISLQYQDDQIVLQVQDNGVGISLEHQTRLFRPYFTTKKFGTGLGLFVVRKIVEAHGGQVAVQSTVGSGTTFTVKIVVAGKAPECPVLKSSSPLEVLA